MILLAVITLAIIAEVVSRLLDGIPSGWEDDDGIPLRR